MTYLKSKGEGELESSSPTNETGAGGQAPVRLRAFNPDRLTTRMKWTRAALSVFVIFHVFSVLLVPNSDNYFGNYFSRLIQPYLYFFEMTNNWNFFSPNPEPPIYVEYQLLNAEDDPYQTGRWPEVKDPYFWRERQTRRITAADFMVNMEFRAEKMMVNYLCHLTPQPHAIRVWRVMESIPRPEEVAAGKRQLGDGVGADKKFVSHTFCAPVGAP